MKRIFVLTFMVFVCGNLVSQICSRNFNHDDTLHHYSSVVSDFKYFPERFQNFAIYFTCNDFIYFLSFEPDYIGKGSRGLFLYKTKNSVVLDSLWLFDGHSDGYSDADDYFTDCMVEIMENGEKTQMFMSNISYQNDSIIIIGGHGNRWMYYSDKIKYVCVPDTSLFGLDVYIDEE